MTWFPVHRFINPTGVFNAITCHSFWKVSYILGSFANVETKHIRSTSIHGLNKVVSLSEWFLQYSLFTIFMAILHITKSQFISIWNIRQIGHYSCYLGSEILTFTNIRLWYRIAFQMNRICFGAFSNASYIF